MLEGDDDPRLREARTNRQFDPNKYYNLKKDIETKKKKVDLQKEKQGVRKDLADQRKKLKLDAAKKGVQTADQKMTAENMQKQEKEHEQAQDAKGQTENPTASV